MSPYQKRICLSWSVLETKPDNGLTCWNPPHLMSGLIQTSQTAKITKKNILSNALITVLTTQGLKAVTEKNINLQWIKIYTPVYRWWPHQISWMQKDWTSSAPQANQSYSEESPLAWAHHLWCGQQGAMRQNTKYLSINKHMYYKSTEDNYQKTIARKLNVTSGRDNISTWKIHLIVVIPNGIYVHLHYQVLKV